MSVSLAILILYIAALLQSAGMLKNAAKAKRKIMPLPGASSTRR